ncbi:S-layer homology domain-containing protein [Cohnella silvisoli]|uniref:S-layer homology domain-containing protein n=1 Tax=Cohnella silvisoli TaxID=2873699 RepID=A0ABV1L3X8_9BACL|nr:S-layer homology domain-containing protein [Cohnella silvisoli]MCD9026340.1 S-layer homology domain-containing protein [Cohnella silvisoli]
MGEKMRIRRCISIFTILFLLAGIIPSYTFAGSLDQWQMRSPYPTSSNLNSIAYGNDTFVAVGDNGTILTSADGASWTDRTSGTDKRISGVIYANNIFVAVGQTGTILTSPDGVMWTLRTSGTGNSLNAVRYGNNTFISVGDGGTVLTSPDSETWTVQGSVTSVTTNSLHSVSYGNGTFVAVGFLGVLITSTDGVNWTQRTSNTVYQLFGVIYSNGTFVAVGDFSTILTSGNGTDWTVRNSGGNYFTEVNYINNNFVAVNGSGDIVTSIDGSFWTGQNTGTDKTLYGISYGNGTYVAVGISGVILTSTNGAAWSIRSSGTDNSLAGVGYGNDTFVAVGLKDVLTSADGMTWKNLIPSLETVDGLSKVSYVNNLFIATGGYGALLTSADGTNWTVRDTGTNKSLQGVSYGESVFVVVGEEGTVLTSTNGETWTVQSSVANVTTDYLAGVSYGNGIFVAVGDFGTVLSSVDGETWTAQESGTDQMLTDVSYANNTFVAVGGAGTILTSADGATWTNRNSGTGNWLNGVSYGSNTFVAVGEAGTVVSSVDGTKWSSRSYITENSLYGVVYGKGLFVIAEESGKIITAKAEPTVSSYSPVDEASGIATGANLQLIFRENILAAAGKSIVIKKASDDSVVETIAAADTTKVIVEGLKVTINPAADLAYSTAYYVQIDDGAFKGAANNEWLGITDKETWSFTTAAAPEPTPSPEPTPAPSPSGTTPSGNTQTGTDTQTGFPVIVNGRSQDGIVTANVTTSGGQTVVTAKVNAGKLEALLAQEGEQPIIVIPVTQNADQVSVVLTRDAMKAMENKRAVLEIQTALGSYKLPAAEIMIDRLLAQFGQSLALADIEVRITIARGSAEKATVLENEANKGQFSIVVPPVDFEVTISDKGKTVTVDKFTTYVEREIAIPDGVDPSTITTAVVLDEDGTLRHVPTYTKVRDGKHFAVVNSLTNSTYSLIGNPKKLEDVQGHWAREAVNDMASRLIVRGDDRNRFQPDAQINRAEFAAIVVRALGLAGNGNTAAAAFADVKSGDWYAGAVGQAKEYGLIEGYGDGTFRPFQSLMRQEAIVIVSKAMKLAGMGDGPVAEEALAVLQPFADSGDVAPWAKQAFAMAIAKRVLLGAGTKLKPLSAVTRAETAVLVQRLLSHAGLIKSGGTGGA